MRDGYPVRSTQPESYDHTIRILGVNGSVTQEDGPGITVTRTGEGAYRATWAENPGAYKGVVGFGFEAATPGDLKGYTVVADTWDSTNLRLDFVVYDSAFAAADLIANQYLTLNVRFATTSL